MAVSFKKPPLNEVALGYTFLPRPDLLIPHLGRFWAELEDMYPVCQHASPIIDSPESEMFNDIPLPRLWFISSDHARLVQLQQDRLLFNWRDTGSGASYVRFPKVKEEFDRVENLFRTYVDKVTGVAIHPTSYSLTYVNLIRQGEGWSKFDDISDVFPDFAWRGGDRFLPPPSQVSCKLDFLLPNGMGNLSAHLQPAKLVKENAPILKFELVANSGSLGGKEIALDDWAAVAHEWIVRAFKDLSSSGMHNKFWLIEKEE